MVTLDVYRAEQDGLRQLGTDGAGAPAGFERRRAAERRRAWGGVLALASLPIGFGSLELMARVEGPLGLVGAAGVVAALTLDLVYARQLSMDEWSW